MYGHSDKRRRFSAILLVLPWQKKNIYCFINSWVILSSPLNCSFLYTSHLQLSFCQTRASSRCLFVMAIMVRAGRRGAAAVWGVCTNSMPLLCCYRQDGGSGPDIPGAETGGWPGWAAQHPRLGGARPWAGGGRLRGVLGLRQRHVPLPAPPSPH